MIDLYTWPTPNGHKIHIMLEEIGMKYRVIPINIQAGDQFKPEFLKISPNNKMPAMIDLDGPEGKPYGLFESGAMLIYLAEKSGQLLPTETVPRFQVIQWMMFQMASIGPLLGQAHHFIGYAPEKIQYAIDRYTKEANRLYTVVNKRLEESPYIAGDEYSIADIALWPWMRRPTRQNVEREEYPAFVVWHDKIGQRPAVERGVQVLAEHQTTGTLTDEARKNMFGDAQYQRR